MRADGTLQFHNAFSIDSYPFKSKSEAAAMKNDFKLSGFMLEKG